MQKIYGYIRVLRTPEPVSIREVFTDVYILEKPQAYRRIDFTPSYKKFKVNPIKRAQTYKRLSLRHKHQLFTKIAAENFDRGKIFFSKRDLVEKIEVFLAHLPSNSTDEVPDGNAVLETISAQHGLLIEQTQGIYSFSHLTFQEYYTAKYIDNTYGGTLDRLAPHLNNPHWCDVFLLTASLLSDATALFWYIMLHLDFSLDLDCVIAPDGNFDLVLN